MKIRFGVGLGPDAGPEHLAETVDHLEGAGVDSLWFSELVYSRLVEPFVGMAFTLARTTRRAAISNPIITESISRLATGTCLRRFWPRFASADPISTRQSSWRPIGRRCTAGWTTTSLRA